MLVSRKLSVTARITVILLLVAGLCAIPLVWYLGVIWGYWPRPHASGKFGVVTGITGGLIAFFELLLWPRKWLRGWRLGAAKTWLKLHIWLGLVCLPLIILHSGFFWGGPLSSWTMVLFLIVIASGLWGWILQQWLPGKIRQDIPNETIASEVDHAMKLHRAEARGIMDELTIAGSSAQKGMISSSVAEQLREFHLNVLDPYLYRGSRSHSLLSQRNQAEKLFQQLRSSLPEQAYPQLRQLEKLCELRHQWDKLVRYQAWLHNWLLVHVPLSLAMTLMMCAHAWQALKLW